MTKSALPVSDSPKRVEIAASPPYSQAAVRGDNLPAATSSGLSMIVQACLNGARGRGYHDRLPLTRDDISRDAADCVAAGAAELHVHPRSDDGCESLTAVDETIRALRRCCPGTLVGVSTGAWIEGDPERSRQCIANWRETPDYASVNLSEPDAPAVIELLRRMSVGVEVGLATVADAERFVALAGAPRAFRILIEIDEQDLARAESICAEIASVLDRHEIRRPVLLHGFDATVWRFVRLARKARWSTRVGLEDGKLLPDGSIARDNAALVAAAVAIFAAGNDR